MSVSNFEVVFEPAHFNHAGAFNVADYWYFYNGAGIRQVFDNEEEALDVSADMQAVAMGSGNR